MTTTPHVQDANSLLLQDLNSALDKLTFGIGSAAGRRPHKRGEPRFHTILACVDASPASENVLSWARDIAKAHQAKVVIASVIPPTVTASGLSSFYGIATGIEEAFLTAEKRLRENVEAAATRMRAAGIEAETVVTSGSIARALADVAATHRADLVILGSHGGNAFSRVALGSTANLLLDRVEASVLVARTAPPHRRLLAATDGSPSSYRAVAYALRQADLAEAELLVQHVLEFPEGVDRIPEGGLLRDVITKMDLKRHPRVTYQLDAGRPADRIVAKADETGADLIVMGSRGLGNVRGILLGSVSHKVVNAARASVLVVKDV